VLPCPAYTLARGDECWVSMQCTGEKSIFYEVGRILMLSPSSE
jgi:hypothetical protein